MQFEYERPKDTAGEPTLADMTRAAIARLSRNGNGYVLLVEAARIDHANHYGNAYRALSDTVAMSDAVRAANEATSVDDTLIIVTADHSHVLNFAGYPKRGNPILGKVRGGSGEDDDAGPGQRRPGPALHHPHLRQRPRLHRRQQLAARRPEALSAHGQGIRGRAWPPRPAQRGHRRSRLHAGNDRPAAQ
jgi:alkaline phosphatase